MQREDELRRWDRRLAIQRPLRYARRLLAMSPREVAARLGPQFPSFRHSTTPPRLDRPRLHAWLDGRFLFGPRQGPAILAAWAEARPTAAARLIAGARGALGSWDVFGTPVALDPRQLDWLAGPDRRSTWELSRHQYFFTLARAGLLTGEPMFAERVVELIESWWAQNPPGRGENWSSALEVAVRSLSWLWTLPLLLAGAHIEARFLERWLASFQEHYQYLRSHLSLYTDPTNHLIGEAAALWTLSVALPGLPQAARTGARALSILTAQVPRQIFPDGAGREQSTGYLQFVLEFLLPVLALLPRVGETVPDPLRERTAAALGFLSTLAGPEGEIPALGDSDGGQGVPLPERNSRGAGEVLTAGAAVLGRPEFSAGQPDLAVWLAGPQSLALPPAAVREPRSRVFAQGGYCFSEAAHGGRRLASLFDAGPLGLWPNASHGHADALSLHVKVDGRWVLGDPGTGSYEAVKPVRDALRGTASHNTVTVDGLDQADKLETFQWLAPFEARLLDAVCTPECDYALAVHEGYRRLRRPVCHYRALVFLRPPAAAPAWLVADRLEGAGCHHGAQRWHFPPGTDVRAESPRRVAAGGLRLAFSGPWRQEAGLWSKRFGAWEMAPVLAVEQEAELPLVWFTWLAPDGQAPPAPFQVERSGSSFAARWGSESLSWRLSAGRHHLLYERPGFRFER